eukprot:gb/GEZN01016998.1/.p1 GENE.gb/GEZN01016998.1/~~gb/GEZN01016998.1/.p1  ORF type:complete len:190 (+),score=49.54 gb/GEZN01016998.1/:35-604(+)
MADLVGGMDIRTKKYHEDHEEDAKEVVLQDMEPQAHAKAGGKTLMVLVDGSEHADKAFKKACMSMQLDDFLILVHAMEAVRPIEGQKIHATFHEANQQLEKDGSKLLKRYEKKAQDMYKVKETNVKAALLLSLGSSAHVKDVVLEFADKHKVDVIFVGRRGISQMAQLLLGSFSNYILSHAHCDVMVVK